MRLREQYVVRVCPECGAQMEAADRCWTAERGEFFGHYHDPPKGWEGEDPWFDAVEVVVVPSRASTSA